VEEAAKRLWDVRLAAVAPVLTIAGIIVGVWQYTDGQQEKARLESKLLIEKDTIEFQRRLWLDRLQACRSIAELAGKIVTHSDQTKFDELAREFLATYWGTMILVQNKPVEQAMIDFSLEIDDFRAGRRDLDRLKRLAYALTQTCRRSVEQGGFGA
jgi:hypothetical protein